MTAETLIGGAVAFAFVYILLSWWIRTLEPERRTRDAALVTKEALATVERRRAARDPQRLAADTRTSSTETSRAGLATESAADAADHPATTPLRAGRQTGRHQIRVVTPPRADFQPWDGKTH